MSQYFENDRSVVSQPSTLRFSLDGKEYMLHTDNGVFSKDKLDTGSRILIETVLKEQERPETLLDLGCGIGPIGLVLQDHWKTNLTMIDVNERAVALAEKNIKKYRLEAEILNRDGVDDKRYECILLNPPIRTGKKVIYRLFDECMDHCTGNFWIVIRKQHGAQSAVNYLKEKGHEVEIVHKEKGYWIIRAS